MKENKTKSINKVFRKVVDYCKFYKQNLLKVNTMNVSLFLIIFAFIITISLSSYNVESMKTISNINDSLVNISIFRELTEICAVILITFVFSFVHILSYKL